MSTNTLEEKKIRNLSLDSLSERHPGLTRAVGDGYAEAAAVCLSRHHEPPTMVSVDVDEKASECRADWNPPDDRTLRAWANEIDTTEAGAYGLTLAAVELEQGLVAVRRAETLTGADYYIAPAGSDASDLEACIRLEVSGTDRGDEKVIEQRLKSKLKQAAAGASNLPAIASVVGFQARAIIMAKLGDDQ
ncbi:MULTISPECIES: hypothetical protein [pseudomallei group]|uniref:hypothetical protein n=1 Tax=pseudomallei group TaxID=111527 RepID=UPI00190F1062|nr:MULTISPECIES: hypothetical protein [pseudomallei group]